MQPFVSGIDLARAYWFDVVAPILDPYVEAGERAAALLGEGSDVLGFDTEQSTDHGWGPKVFVCFDRASDREHVHELRAVIDDALPETFRGYPIRYPRRDGAPPRHQVLMTTVEYLFAARLGYDPRRASTIDWLTAPTQMLRSLTAGAVFDDGPGDLTAARAALRWYPDDVWLYVLGCQWRRIGQEEAFVGRCGQVGDELGSAVVAARLVRDYMRLCFLIARQYAPYSKWLGTAFARLDCANELLPEMRAVLHADAWRDREEHLVRVSESVAGSSTRSGSRNRRIQPCVRSSTVRSSYWAATASRTCAWRPRRCATLGWPGAVDQFADSTDVLSSAERAQRVTRSLYEPDPGSV